jgi:all-trans-8'-apo-beta-carotenal 15,15'-oxygenase
MEAAHPIEIDPVTLETREMVVLPGVRGSLTAHPKFDRATDELISFGYIPPASKVNYYVHRAGQPVHVGAVEFAENAAGKFYSRMPHDFACTERWSVFYDSPPIRFYPPVLFGLSSAVDPTPSRLVFVPRHNSSAVRSVPVESGAVFHFANAYESDGGVVTVVGCKSGQTGSYFNLDAARFVPYLYEWRIDVNRDVLISEGFLLSDGQRVAMEFPGVNDRFAMRKTRFTFGMTIAEEADAGEGARGITKYDHVAGRAETFRLAGGGDWHFQEPLFVGSGEAAEDAGSLVTFVFDRRTELSSLLIVDASTMTQTALIPLGTRVPMGFHTLFLDRSQLTSQKK